MINDDAGYSWNGEVYSYPYLYDHSRYPYSAASMHHDHSHRTRSDRYNGRRGMSSNQPTFPPARNHSFNEESGRSHNFERMTMRRDDVNRDFESTAEAARSRKRRDTSEHSPYLPSRLGEADIFPPLEASFSNSIDQGDDRMESSAKRARTAFRDQDVVAHSYPGGDTFSDPYEQVLNTFIDPDYIAQTSYFGQPSLQPSSDDFYAPSLSFRGLGSSFPIEHSAAAPVLLPSFKRSDSMNEFAIEDNEDNRKPAAVQTDSTERRQPTEVSVAEATEASPLSAASSSFPSPERRGGERTSESAVAPSEEELDACTNSRAREALVVWYKRLSQLIAFKKISGSTDVRQKFNENPPLGIWVNKQRCSRRTLSQAKLRALEKINFHWGKKKGQFAWDQKFNELAAYKAQHGDCLVPTKCAANPSLGRWVSTQRSQYKNLGAGKRSTMTSIKIRRLEKIGFVWSMVD